MAPHEQEKLSSGAKQDSLYKVCPEDRLGAQLTCYCNLLRPFAFRNHPLEGEEVMVAGQEPEIAQDEKWWVYPPIPVSTGAT